MTGPNQSLLRIFNPFYTVGSESHDHIELQTNDPRQALPAGRLKLKATDPLSDVAVTCSSTIVPVVYDRIPDWETWPPPYRWSGRIDVAHDQFKDGLRTVDCELIGDKHWLDRILCWPSPFLPIWVQFPAQWFGIGPGLSVIATLIMEQSFRIQSGLWSIIDQIGSLAFPFQDWIQELRQTSSMSLIDILQVLHTPICVVPINPFRDGSAWIEINGRMDTVWKLVQQQMQDNGFDMTVQMWLPGEPQPPGLAFPLRNATVVIELFDRSGFTGPWGPLEGVVVDAVQLEGSLMGNALNPILGNAPQSPYVETDLGEYLAPNIGVNFKQPWVILNCDVEKSGIIEYSIDFHHPLAWQVVTGGQSPQVGAPPVSRGGTGFRGVTMDQRPDQLDARVARRRADDRHRPHGPARQHPRRHPRQRAVRLQPRGELRHEVPEPIYVPGEVLSIRGGFAHAGHPVC
jgi:hypothetical protein